MILIIGNTFDLLDKRWSDSYRERIKIDERHNVSLRFIGQKNKVISTESENKRIIEQVFSYEEYELDFIVNTNTAQQLANLKKLDYFTITTDIETITPEEKEINISDHNGNNEYARKCTITYRINFINKRTGDTNLPTPDVDVVPVASDVLITGNSAIGSTVTGNYTYFDADDAEGASIYTWWYGDDLLDPPTNFQLLSGETSQTLLLTSTLYNKYVFFQVIPVAATGLSPGIAVMSPGFQAEVNNIPIVSDISISSDGNYFVGSTATAAYTYTDVEDDTEASTSFQWQYSFGGTDEIRDSNKMTFDTTIVDNITLEDFPDDGKLYTHIRVGITPKAATGATPGNKVFSDWTRML